MLIWTKDTSRSKSRSGIWPRTEKRKTEKKPGVLCFQHWRGTLVGGVFMPVTWIFCPGDSSYWCWLHYSYTRTLNQYPGDPSFDPGSTTATPEHWTNACNDLHSCLTSETVLHTDTYLAQLLYCTLTWSVTVLHLSVVCHFVALDCTAVVL